MIFSITDRVVVLTGAASGIGAALAIKLAALGAALALIDQNEAGLLLVAEQARALGARVSAYALDVTDQAAVAALPDRIASDLGIASLLINNAGIGLLGSFTDVTATQFDRVLAVNFFATVAMTRAFLPQLHSNTPSAIVNMSSLFGLIGVPGQTAYSSSKFAVRGFSEALRSELRGTGVSLLVVHPGGVRTNIAKRSAVGFGIDTQTEARMQRTAEKFLRAEPGHVADRIVKALMQREHRVLIGTDAHLLNALQRLFPVAYRHIFRLN